MWLAYLGWLLDDLCKHRNFAFCMLCLTTLCSGLYKDDVAWMLGLHSSPSLNLWRSCQHSKLTCGMWLSSGRGEPTNDTELWLRRKCLLRSWFLQWKEGHKPNADVLCFSPFSPEYSWTLCIHMGIDCSYLLSWRCRAFRWVEVRGRSRRDGTVSSPRMINSFKRTSF